MQNSRYRWANHDLRKAQIPQSLHHPPLPLPTFHSRSEQPREASEKDALSSSTAFATFKVILGFITMGIFFGTPLFFLIVLADYNPFRSMPRLDGNVPSDF